MNTLPCRLSETPQAMDDLIPPLSRDEELQLWSWLAGLARAMREKEEGR